MGTSRSIGSIALATSLCVALGSAPGCTCADTSGTGLNDGSPVDGGTIGDGGTVDDGSTVGDGGTVGDGIMLNLDANSCMPPTSIAITPANSSANVTIGAPFTQAFMATATYPGGATMDVTGSTFFKLSDPGLGTFSGATFTWSGTQGGVVTVSGQSCGVQGSTPFTINLSGGIAADPAVNLPMAQMQFGPGATPSTVASCAPTLIYPPDGVLIPPNMNVVEVHFLMGGPPANQTYEISFENAVTDIKVYTKCTGATAAQGMPLGGGCVFELDQAEWNFIAHTNRDGGPVTVKVRAVGCDGANVASSNTRQISFAKEDLIGTLYYWASMRITVGGLGFNSGGIFRYDFGVRGQSADPVLTPNTAANSAEHNCIGCHSISRDGRQMVFDYDDNDDDDEYGDVFTDIYDIAQQTAVKPIIKGLPNAFPPGYHTWNRTTAEFLLSDGPGNTATPNGAFARISPLAAIKGYAQAGSLRGTTPDWAPDDTTVVFAVPPNVSAAPPAAGYWDHHVNNDDLWFAGASLYVAPWNTATKQLGAASLVLGATGTSNYYYPSYSPEGSFIAFNYAPSGANYHNAKARVQLVPAGMSNPTPLDLEKLNGSPAIAPVDTTNSWARWSPFVQNYKTGKILWITFSSTRNYGVRLDNGGKTNCYAAESPIGPFFTAANNCTRTQIWMAAINLDANAVSSGTDVSRPAFFLPFQDMNTNNHLAQWAQQSFSGTCMVNSDCGAGRCCFGGGCAACPPPPPPNPNCTTNTNCSTGLCCVSGACTGCPGMTPPPDAGAPPTGCASCLDCQGQACINGTCGACTNSSQCCAPLVCQNGSCVTIIF